MKNFLYIFWLLFLGNTIHVWSQGAAEPVNLGPAINSEYEELSPVMSGDGNRLFFVRMNHPDNRYGRKNSQDIWMSEKDASGNWKEAERLPGDVNISRYNAVFWSNEDGTEIIIKGVFNKAGTDWKERGFSKIMSKDNGKWGKPKPIKIKGFDNKNDGALTSAFFSDDENTLLICFSSTVNGKKSDIFLSTKKGRSYTRPKKLKEVSSKYDEQAPFLSESGKVLYFSSKLADNYNIYISEKKDSLKGKWSAATPVNLGFNTSGWESYFRLINGEKSAVFVSDQNTIGKADIFFVDFQKKEEPAPQVAEQIAFKGIIKDGGGKKLPFTNFRLIVDSVDTEYINQSPDSAAFEIMLPSREKYTVTALLPGYDIDTVTLLADNKGLALYDIELLASKIFVEKTTVARFTLSGTVVDEITGKILPASISPSISLDNASVESSSYDPETGFYSFTFTQRQGNPIVTVLADGYRAFTKVVYTTEGISSISLTIGLTKKSSSSVVLSGKILNAKTNAPLEDIQGFSLVVNGENIANLAYIKEEKTYQITLEKGKKYSLEPNLKGFFGVNETVDLTTGSSERIEKDLYLTPLEIGQSVKLENIFFKSGSAELLNESIPELKRVSNFLKENSSIVIEIGGHTDNIGSDSFNLELSEERAKSVARYIILSGVPRQRIEFKGYGETQPVASNDSAQGREQNRRVEFKVLKNY